MTSKFKSVMRDALPQSLQVPLKYHLNRWFGELEPEMALLPHLVSPGDRAVDIGGNRGAYAFRLSQLGARVEVFEPNPACNKVLRAWAAGHPAVTVPPFGLSDHTGTIVLRIPIDASGVEHDASASVEPHAFVHAREQVIELRRLDSFGFEGVTFIKIDVEGHEYNVLCGATSLLAKARPAVLVEIEQRHLQRPIGDVFSLLVNAGYRGWFLDGAILKSIDAFDVHRDQAASAFGVQGQRYINNFLFLAQDRVAETRYGRLLEAFGAA
jgi:FkbM family methyltransferase